MAGILFKIVKTCNSKFKCNYLQNEKLFLDFLFDFWNLHQVLNIFKKGMIVIANVFPKLKNMKRFVRPLSKKRCLRTRIHSHHLKAFQNTCKISMRAFLSCFSSFSGKSICRISPIVLDGIAKVLVKTWIAADKYLVQDCENLQLPIQMQLSEN